MVLDIVPSSFQWQTTCATLAVCSSFFLYKNRSFIAKTALYKYSQLHNWSKQYVFKEHAVVVPTIDMSDGVTEGCVCKSGPKIRLFPHIEKIEFVLGKDTALLHKSILNWEVQLPLATREDIINGTTLPKQVCLYNILKSAFSASGARSQVPHFPAEIIITQNEMLLKLTATKHRVGGESQKQRRVVRLRPDIENVIVLV